MQFRFRYAPSKLYQTRAFLEPLDEDINRLAYVRCIPRSIVRFTRRAVLEGLECGDFDGREHMAKLSQLDYVLVHRGLNGRPFIYELVVDYREMEAVVANLVAIFGQGQGVQPRPPTTH